MAFEMKKVEREKLIAFSFVFIPTQERVSLFIYFRLQVASERFRWHVRLVACT